MGCGTDQKKSQGGVVRNVVKESVERIGVDTLHGQVYKNASTA